MPGGRTIEYTIFRACERFGKWPDEFYDLDRESQVKILSFCSIREEEDAMRIHNPYE